MVILACTSFVSIQPSHLNCKVAGLDAYIALTESKVINVKMLPCQNANLNRAVHSQYWQSENLIVPESRHVGQFSFTHSPVQCALGQTDDYV